MRNAFDDQALEEQEEILEGQDSSQEQEAVEKSRVHPLDPDFLVFAMPFAFLVDALDIVLEITGILVIPKVIGMVFDGFTFVVISWWMYTRVKRIAQTRDQMKKGATQKLRGAQRQLQQRALQSVGRSPLRRVLFRGLAVLIGELIPFVGLIPFWSITVFSTLREK